jgi:hypothetical protein
MADDRTARLLARQERLRLEEEMAQANQDILTAITDLVRVIGDQNTAQAAVNQLLQDAVDAMRDNTAAAAGGAGGAAAAAATFAISPGTIAPDALIDYSTKIGGFLYKLGKSALDENEKFDCQQEQLPQFLTLLEKRTKAMGWDDPNQGITPITHGVGAAAQVVDGLRDYGSYDLDDVTRTCTDYVIEGEPKQQSRAAQNNAAAADCLMESVTSRVKNLLLTDESNWKMNSRVDGSGEDVDVAMKMFKELIRYTTLDTRSTDSILRTRIRHLPDYSATVKGNIPMIHTQFTNTLMMLKARHQDIDDKETILFDTYRVSPNENFRRYMAKLEDEFLENHPNMANADYQVIMRKALQRYNVITENQQWDALSPEQESIIALKTELLAVKGDALKLSKKLADIGKKGDKKQKAAKSSPEGAEQQQMPNKLQQPKQGGVKKNKKNTFNKKQQKADEAWKKVPPAAGKPHTMQQNGKTWHWCEFHMMWCIHTSEECRLNPKNAAQKFQANKAHLHDSNEEEDDGPTQLEQMMATLAMSACAAG